MSDLCQIAAQKEGHLQEATLQMVCYNWCQVPWVVDGYDSPLVLELEIDCRCVTSM